MQNKAPKPLIAIACGGTGGHFFPGLAVAEALQMRGCKLLLLISPKEVDQQAVRTLHGIEVATLPAVGLERGRGTAFLTGFIRSWGMARRLFRTHRPAAVLGMGGFTSAPPVLAGTRQGSMAFLHEANSIPGRANRWLAHVVDEAFVYFQEASGRLWQQRVRTTGMPVRSQFEEQDIGACRVALGLKPDKPVLLIMGGSQGATALNDLVLRLLPSLALLEPGLQFIHLTGQRDAERARAAYSATGRKAMVAPFLTEMEMALGAATVAISRAGASSLAEIAAMGIPSILVPYPTAADNHQYFNARAFAETGAARYQLQAKATPETLLWEIRELLKESVVRKVIRDALRQWAFPQAADAVAQAIIASLPPQSRSQLNLNHSSSTNELPAWQPPMPLAGPSRATAPPVVE